MLILICLLKRPKELVTTNHITPVIKLAGLSNLQAILAWSETTNISLVCFFHSCALFDWFCKSCLILNQLANYLLFVLTIHYWKALSTSRAS